MITRARISTAVACSALAVAAAGAQTVRDSLRLYYVGRPVGWERYEVVAGADGSKLSSDFDYIDRGRRNHLQATLEMGAGYAPRRLEVTRIADTSRTVVTRIEVDGTHASVLRSGKTSTAELPNVSFALSPYTPMAQHIALLRYWKAHGSPASMAGVRGVTSAIEIKQLGVDTLGAGASRTILTRYGIDGIVWGTEYAWLDGSERLAMFARQAVVCRRRVCALISFRRTMR